MVDEYRALLFRYEKREDSSRGTWQQEQRKENQKTLSTSNGGWRDHLSPSVSLQLWKECASQWHEDPPTSQKS
ncbi:hypothetical protein Taro_030746 [Colocasia esculenta]|uniref:Uncharacterized protein n=1 Tax=Colocasia esculenta TaxID=4460 RepID=A0A843VPZ1_COLES|nr:hypothetical protein [Colocasia esculenta]